MNLFFWKNNKKHDDFANSLASEFMEIYPPPDNTNLRQKKLEQKFKKVTQRIYSQAKDYSREFNLGVYSKARIGNKFMWVLKEKGYEEILIEELTTNLLRSLDTTKQTKQTK